jgi:hypothetical protein
VNVGDGGTDGVSVGIKVWIRVTVSVGEGSGLKVQVAALKTVGTGWEIKVNPPHPTEKRVVSAIATKDLFKFLQWMIQIPQNA